MLPLHLEEYQFVYFVNNLFTNSSLTKALLALNISIYSTVRKDVIGILPMLKTIQAAKKTQLDLDDLIYRIVENDINIIMWNDPLQNHRVFLLTIVYTLSTTLTASQRTRFISIKTHRDSFARITI